MTNPYSLIWYSESKVIGLNGLYGASFTLRGTGMELSTLDLALISAVTIGTISVLVVLGSYPTKFACLPVYERTLAFFPKIQESALPSEIAYMLSLNKA